MLNLIGSVISYKLYKNFGFPKTLPTILTLSINDWCNSRCKTCSIWKNNPASKRKEELRLDEIKRIFSNFKRIYWLTITGGEPFLRKDLNEVIKTIYDESRPEVITIATNGILTKRIVSWTKEILNHCQGLKLVVNLSLDGIGKQNDKIRGIEGNFKSTTRTLKELKALNHPRLTVGVNTVISVHNVVDLPQIYTHIMEKFNPDSYICEIAENRAKLYNMGLKITPEIRHYQRALTFLIESFKKQKSSRDVPEIIRILRIEFYKYLMQHYHLSNFEGIASAYIMHNGNVWVSYTKPYVIGNLRDVGYDFKKLWFNEKARSFRKMMDSNSYNPMLVNAFYSSIVCNISKISKLWLRSRFS